MFSIIYIEEEVKSHDTTLRITNQFKGANIVYIHHYGEVFNRASQHFRLQKDHPALIVAKKQKGYIHPTPPTYDIGCKHNYYFSHLLNCPFDCKYCFLQAMYRSAHYVYFINHEDFQNEIERTLEQHQDESVTIFTGYDGDSLALESITHFFRTYYPFFEKHKKVTFEIRTKSSNIQPLLQLNALDNVVIAYSLNPPVVAKEIETKASSAEKRLDSIRALQEKGWKIGLRFDPVISFKDDIHHYQQFFNDLFSIVNIDGVHSATLGKFRMPAEFKKKMQKLLPNEPLIHSNQNRDDLLDFCKEELLKHLPLEKLFLC